MSSGLQNKMHSYEVAPPAGVWEKITHALDESEMAHEFPTKLYDLEITPPVTAWETIKASLVEEQAVPVPPESKKWVTLFRYAAAASVIGLIAWGGIQLLNKKSGVTGAKEMAKQEATEPEKSTDNPSSEKNSGITGNTTSTGIDEARNDAALEDSKKTYAKLDLMAAGNRMNKTAADYYTGVAPVNDPEEEVYGELHYAGVVASAAHNYQTNSESLTDRYITLMTPDGNIIRMSKKLSNLVCCVSGEEQDEECKDQMKDWRKKIACSSVTTSSDNFMDILNLVNSLQENH